LTSCVKSSNESRHGSCVCFTCFYSFRLCTSCWARRCHGKCVALWRGTGHVQHHFQSGWWSFLALLHNETSMHTMSNTCICTRRLGLGGMSPVIRCSWDMLFLWEEWGRCPAQRGGGLAHMCGVCFLSPNEQNCPIEHSFLEERLPLVIEVKTKHHKR
jgi:hypothetical protein